MRSPPRRQFVLAGGALLATAFAARAQRTAPPHVAVVLSTAPATASARLTAFREGMKEQGYVDGRSVLIDARSWAGATAPLPELAAALVRSAPVLIVAEGNAALIALKKATQSIPIVMAVVGDPVGTGLVASLARPGGNITGLSNTAERLSGKRLELLKEMIPGLARAAVLRNPGIPTHAILLQETAAAAGTLGTTLVPYDLASEADLEKGFAAMAREGVQAAVVLPQPLGIVLRKPLADTALRHRMPVMFPSPEPVEAGGLAAYGPNHTELWRRTASYVDRILKGARPEELPIEQPTRFDLVLNLKTARALGLTIPPALLLRAAQTIE